MTKNCPLQSSIGRKSIVAVSGFIMLGFVIVHMLGNLQIFMGQNQLNSYAVHLRDLGPILWAARGVLVAALLIHIFFAIQLAIENRKARPVRYVSQNKVQASFASLSMALTGTLLLCYIIYHLLHLTFRVTHPEFQHMTDALGRHDVYSMLVKSFQNVYLAGFYIAAMLPLSLHLGHGASSWLQTLGLNNETYEPCLKKAGTALAIFLFAGYSVIPVSVLLNLLKLPGQ